MSLTAPSTDAAFLGIAGLCSLAWQLCYRGQLQHLQNNAVKKQGELLAIIFITNCDPANDKLDTFICLVLKTIKS